MIELNDIRTLTLFVSGSCNLNCEYCYIHKNKSLLNINKEISEAWENGEYLKNVDKCLRRLGADPFNITTIDFWGGESTLNLGIINNKIKDLVDLFPNLNKIGFSSNFMIGVDETIDFLKQLNTHTHHNLNVWLQQSIDGPEGILTQHGHNGNWETYRKNYEKLSTFLNTYRLDYISEVSINIKPTIDRSIYLDYFSKEENINSYIEYMDNTYELLKDLFVNSKVKLSVVMPKPATPMTYTQKEGEQLVDIFNKWEKCAKKYMQTHKKYYPGLRNKLYGYLHRYNENDEIYRDTPPGCSKNLYDLAIMPDGTITDCTSDYMYGRDDYTENCKEEKDKITSRIYKKYNFNALTDTDEQLKSDLWLNTIGLTLPKSLKTNLCAGLVKELALSGQIPDKFKNGDMLLRGAKFSQYQADCIIQQIETTRVPFLFNTGVIKMHLNGFYDLVEKDFKDKEKL